MAAVGGGFSDFFENFFGGLGGGFSGRGAAGRAPRGFTGYEFTEEPPRGRDIEAEVEVPLRDAMRGAKMRITLNAEDGCTNCGGTGVVAREETPRQNARGPCRRSPARCVTAAARSRLSAHWR